MLGVCPSKKCKHSTFGHWCILLPILELSDTWRPPFDNEVTIEEAYGNQVVSNARAWDSTGLIRYSSPIELYLSFEPEPLFLRRVDDEYCYAVYNAEGGGRVFVFFRGRTYPLNPEKVEYLRTLSIYMTDVLCYNDFSDIMVGDPIEKVVSIDRSAEYTQKNAQFTKRYQTYHLLTDGFLTIKYEESGDNLRVSQLIFNKEFVMDCSAIFDLSDEELSERFEIQFGGIVRKIQILPQDYPSA